MWITSVVCRSASRFQAAFESRFLGFTHKDSRSLEWGLGSCSFKDHWWLRFATTLEPLKSHRGLVPCLFFFFCSDLEFLGFFFFLKGKRDRHRNLPSACLFPKCQHHLRQGQAKTNSQELDPCLLSGWQGPNHLILLLQGCELIGNWNQAENQDSSLGTQIWHAGVPSRILNPISKRLTPKIQILKFFF